jgi:hypothetical protein
VNRDTIRLAMHGKRYEALAEPLVKAISNIMIRSLFLSGHEVVIYDETNYSRLARNFVRDDEMFETVFYEVDTPPEVCKERAIATGQEDLIPIIDAMAKRYEPLGVDERRYSK